MKLGRTIATALGSAFAFGGCGNIIGVGSLSGGGPDASIAGDAATGGRDTGGTSAASGGSGGSGGEQSGGGGASGRALLDSGGRPVLGTSFDARAPTPNSDAGRHETVPGKHGIEDAGGAPRDASPPGNCVPGQSERWIPWSGVTAPDDGYVLSSEPDPSRPNAGDYTFYICRARDTAGNVIPGTFVDTLGCFYTPDGTTRLQASNFDVLADPSNCLDYASYSGSVPANSVEAGDLGQIPLYVCVATPSQAADGVFVAGYMEDVPGATCRVPYHQDAYDIPTGFWILIVD